jgi:16S rRNA (guanine527-N7)-methyltransferase
VRWNEKVNLVSRRDVDRLWPRHIEESIALHSLVEGESVLDVGTGGGLPGMVLAILDAGAIDSMRRYTLLERSERKCRFLRHVVAELQLNNVHVICADVDSAECPAGGYATVCARALASPALLWPRLRRWLAADGQLLIACGPQSRKDLPAEHEMQGFTLEWLTPGANAATPSETFAHTNQRGVVRISMIAKEDKR